MSLHGRGLGRVTEREWWPGPPESGAAIQGEGTASGLRGGAGLPWGCAGGWRLLCEHWVPGNRLCLGGRWHSRGESWAEWPPEAALGSLLPGVAASAAPAAHPSGDPEGFQLGVHRRLKGVGEGRGKEAKGKKKRNRRRQGQLSGRGPRLEAGTGRRDWQAGPAGGTAPASSPAPPPTLSEWASGEAATGFLPQPPRDTGTQSRPARVGGGRHSALRAPGDGLQSASAQPTTFPALPWTDERPRVPR